MTMVYLSPFVLLVEDDLSVYQGVCDKFYILIFCYFLGWFAVFTHITHDLKAWTLLQSYT